MGFVEWSSPATDLSILPLIRGVKVVEARGIEPLLGDPAGRILNPLSVRPHAWEGSVTHPEGVY